jgi:hypothetical protein
VMATAPAPRFLRSRGGAKLALARHRTEARMVPLLQLTTAVGAFQIEFGADELRAVLSDALRLVSADPAEVASWWSHLSGIDAPAATGAVTNGRPDVGRP